MTTTYICSVCGKEVRGIDRGRGIGVRLTRTHTITGKAAERVGRRSGSRCPSKDRGDHQPKYQRTSA